MKRGLQNSTIDDMLLAVQDAIKKAGTPYSGYSPKKVSWDDVCRSKIDEAVSFYGPNITDTQLFSNATNLFTLRPDNHIEKIGKVSSDEFSLLCNIDGEQRLVTLTYFLKNIGMVGSYVGMDTDTNLYNPDTDGEVGVRFQVSFVPVADDEESVPVHSEMYSYGTTTDDNPQNLVVLCTSECSSLQYPGAGSTVLHQHVKHEDGLYHSHTLSVQKTSYGVGGSQEESAEEVQQNNANGQANAVRIGVKHMGKRFNVVMTLQIPIEQAKTEYRWQDESSSYTSVFPKYKSLSFECGIFDDDEPKYTSLSAIFPMDGDGDDMWRGTQTRSLVAGVSNAARVNTGADAGLAKKLVVQKPKRKTDQHITATIIMYYSVSGGVPGVQDVKSAILDMEELFSKCNWSGKLDGSDDLSDPKAWSGKLNSSGASFMVQSVQSNVVKTPVDPDQSFPSM